MSSIGILGDVQPRRGRLLKRIGILGGVQPRRGSNQRLLKRPLEGLDFVKCDLLDVKKFI